MFSNTTYTNRRNGLKKYLDGGILLFLGHDEPPRNGPQNFLPFRQNSTFLYYFGLDKPGLAAIIDLDSGTETIYGNDFDIEDIVWMGPQPKLKDMAAEIGISTTKQYSELLKDLKISKSQNRTIHFLPEYRSENKLKLYHYIDINPAEVKMT